MNISEVVDPQVISTDLKANSRDGVLEGMSQLIHQTNLRSIYNVWFFGRGVSQKKERSGIVVCESEGM